jgi:hypothetical protein
VELYLLSPYVFMALCLIKHRDNKLTSTFRRHTVSIFRVFLLRPLTRWIPETLFSRIMRPGRETNDSPSSNVEVNNYGAIPPLPIRLHGVVLN